MADIEKAIKAVESNIGRKLTDEEKQAAEMIGGLMNGIWTQSTPGGRDGQERAEADGSKFHDGRKHAGGIQGIHPEPGAGGKER